MPIRLKYDDYVMLIALTFHDIKILAKIYDISLSWKVTLNSNASLTYSWSLKNVSESYQTHDKLRQK